MTRRELSALVDNLRSKSSTHTAPARQIEITNKAGKLKIGDITTATIEKLLQELSVCFGASAAKNGMQFGELTAHAENAVDTLDLEIHSPGGSVFDGMRLYHELVSLRARGVRVTATINALAASMGSVIAMSADRIKMVSGGRMMIHEVSSSAGGTAADHARSAKLCEDLSNDLAGIYSRRTGRPQAAIREMMRAETWMNAVDALAGGFIDEIIGAQKPAASAIITLAPTMTPAQAAACAALLGKTPAMKPAASHKPAPAASMPPAPAKKPRGCKAGYNVINSRQPRPGTITTALSPKTNRTVINSRSNQ